MSSHYSKFLEKRLKQINIHKYGEWWFNEPNDYELPSNFVLGIIIPACLWFLAIFVCGVISIGLDKIYSWNITDNVLAFITVPALTYYIIFFSLFFIVPIAQTIGAFLGALIDNTRFKNRFSDIDSLYSNDPKYIIPGSLFGFIPNDKIDFFHYGNPFIDKLNTKFFDSIVEIIQVDGNYVLFAEKMRNRNAENIKDHCDNLGYNYYTDDDNFISMKICDFCDIYRYTGKYNKDFL